MQNHRTGNASPEINQLTDTDLILGMVSSPFEVLLHDSFVALSNSLNQLSAVLLSLQPGQQE